MLLRDKAELSLISLIKDWHAYIQTSQTHLVHEEKEATEEAEEVSSEQREVHCCGARHLHHYRHEAV